MKRLMFLAAMVSALVVLFAPGEASAQFRRRYYRGPVVVHHPGYHAPVYHAPVYHAPAYHPGYHPAVYHRPVYHAPVHHPGYYPRGRRGYYR